MQPQDTIHTQNQCIFQVPAFISNARPFIHYIKSYLSTKILFSKISFFFSKFCPILFDFILFFFKKKKFPKIFYCSSLLFIVTVHLSCNTIFFFFYFNTLPAYCNTPPSHNTVSVLQYNPAAQLPLNHNTLQILQYNFPATKPLYCNTVFSSSQAAHVTIQWCIEIQNFQPSLLLPPIQ